MKIEYDEIIEIEEIQEEDTFWDITTETENFIAEEIITHNSTPHKKSISVGTYLPDTLKEKIDIVIAIDVSGSIREKELNDFLSEIIGIAKIFQERITMRLLTHEIEINNDYIIHNGNIEKIKKLKIEGGGGTSHIQPFDFIAENVRDCKCCIFLTDGYSDIEQIDFNKYSFDKLFVISKGGTDKCFTNKKCKVIKLGKVE